MGGRYLDGIGYKPAGKVLECQRRTTLNAFRKRSETLLVLKHYQPTKAFMVQIGL
jgi:hypothetical protein